MLLTIPPRIYRLDENLKYPHSQANQVYVEFELLKRKRYKNDDLIEQIEKLNKESDFETN